MEENTKKTTRRRKNPTQVMKKRLQAEIENQCPFCNDTNVETFEFHHIDGDSSNTVESNLIMICPTCHAKIDKSIITTDEVRKMKNDLLYNKKSKKEAKSVTQNNTFNSSVNNSVIGNVENVYLNQKKVNKPIIQATDIHITQEQVFNIKTLIEQIVEIHVNAGKISTQDEISKAYRDWGAKLKRKFKVANRNLILKEQYDDVIKWLRQQAAMNKPKLRRTNNPEWRKKQYSAIWAKARQLNLDKETVYEIAAERLSLKTPINSLKDLGEQNLDKLYKIVIAMK